MNKNSLSLNIVFGCLVLVLSVIVNNGLDQETEIKKAAGINIFESSNPYTQDNDSEKPLHRSLNTDYVKVVVTYTLPLPEVSTLVASGVGATSAIFNGNITDDGGLTVTVRGFEYGITTSSVSTVSESGSFGTGAFSLVATDLEPEEIYYFRAFATNEYCTGYGDWENAAAARGCNPPISGDFEITDSCTFPGFVNGVEEQNDQDGEGDLIIDEGVTLTINCGKDVGQTVVWNPGSKVIINGSIAICKGAGMTGGQLRKSHLWMIDADNDTYSTSTTQYASLNAPSGDHQRRYTMATTTNVDCNDSSGYVYRLVAGLGADGDNDSYISGATGTQCVGQQEGNRYRAADGSYSWLHEDDSLGADTNDSNDCIDTTTHLCCDDTNPTDGLQPAKSAGDQDLPACQRCDGVSIEKVDVDDNTQDTQGSSTCSDTCKKCSSGSCVNQISSEDLFTQCSDSECYSGSCDGSGSCGYQTSEQDLYSYCSDTSGCWTGNCIGGSNACGYYTSGEHNCTTVCTTCTGATSGSCVNITGYNEDDEGSYTCTDACKGCSDGSCVNFADNTGDSIGSNKCDDSSGYCYRCLSGSCTYQTAGQDLFNECPGTLGTCAASTCSGSDYSCGYLAVGQQGCGACKYCTGSSYSCANRSTGYDCGGVCQSCSGGSCVNTAYGQDYQGECPGSKGTCAGSACNGSGDCQYLSGQQGCATCKYCNGFQYYCISANTDCGNNLYGCTGSNKRCLSGSCMTAKLPGESCIFDGECCSWLCNLFGECD